MRLVRSSNAPSVERLAQHPPGGLKMPLERRCLIAGCDCPGYAFDMDTHEGTEEETVETERDELKPYCSLCGHTEEEHEMTRSDDEPS
ncbi:MAG TPA: hypothetical protein VGW37_00035 [Terriglobia bacterium]|nr:hypothetical protein [Terriglobia bacterium]